MSEYQYYEFRAIDRPLDAEQMDELGKLSTRAEITPTSFVNTYSYGDFRGDPDALMDRYFDAFVYVANWGTRRLMLRLPRAALDVDAARAYCDGEVLSLKAGKGHVVIAFRSEDEGGGEWVEGEPWMPALAPIRDELMRGDLRALYLGWLASFLDRGYFDADADADEVRDEPEPPVPPGLATLSAPLRALAEFLRIDDDLLAAAAAGSVGEAPAAPSRADLARWVKSLPAAEKDAYLVRFVAEEGDVSLRAELSRRFREAVASAAGKPAPAARRRTVAELLAARDAMGEARSRRQVEKAAEDRARREFERAAYLDGLARREAEVWSEVEALIDLKRAKEYDQAVALLVDLRDLAERTGQARKTAERLRDIRRRHSGKSSFIRRLDEKKLGR
jgi:hypothetical protein